LGAQGAADIGSPLVLTAWFAVHGLATLWIDGALPKKGLNPERLALIVKRYSAACSPHSLASSRRHRA